MISQIPKRSACFSSFRLGKITGLLVMAVGLMASSLMAQTIQFDALAVKGGKKAEASCVILDAKGTVATIVEMGADMKKATMVADGKRIPLTFVINDVNSRLAIYTLPADSKVSASSPAVMGNSLLLAPSQEVFTSVSDGKDSARIVARVTRFQGKILPLAVFRVNHSKLAPRPGTGMYNADGKFIGIIRQSVFGSTNSSYCLPSEVIARTLKDQKKHGQIRRCWIGIVMDDLVAPPIVESVRPNSPAQKAGLKNGDLILSIGKQQVKDYADVVDAFFYLIADEPQTFKVLRGTEIKEISITPEVSPRG